MAVAGDGRRTTTSIQVLPYSRSDGTTVVPYDNERTQGDHKHIGETQTDYEFESVEKLVSDFFADVRAHGGQL